jgi:hypothetical protein
VTFNKDDDWQQQMRDNGDNFPELNQGNRCIETDLHVLRNQKLFNKLESLIESYRYSNALELLKFEKRFNESELFNLISVAEAYASYNLAEVNGLIKKTDLTLPPSEPLQKLVVAFNNLELKIQTKEYNDFCIRITPLFYNLLIEIIGERIIKSITYKDNNDVKKIDIKAIDKFPTLKANITDYKVLSPQYMLYLYYDISGNNQIYKMLNIIREVEKKARNKAAHEVGNISEKTIKNLSGHKVEDVIKAFMVVLLNSFNKKIGKRHLSFYSTINEMIKAKLNDMKAWK